MTDTVRLTEYSHGAGCGCKISPKVLTEILETQETIFADPRLLVGNETRDDAAVYALDDERVIISTTDFFMPIVDDPRDFGGIASVNAISDIFAMGGKPIMAVAILGWPINKLDPAIARRVIEGSREACARAGILHRPVRRQCMRCDARARAHVCCLVCFCLRWLVFRFMIISG